MHWEFHAISAHLARGRLHTSALQEVDELVAQGVCCLEVCSPKLESLSCHWTLWPPAHTALPWVSVSCPASSFEQRCSVCPAPGMLMASVPGLHSSWSTALSQPKVTALAQVTHNPSSQECLCKGQRAERSHWDIPQEPPYLHSSQLVS